MPKVPLQTTAASTLLAPPPPLKKRKPSREVRRSLAFWLMLFSASFCCAASVLAPKLAISFDLKREYIAGQQRLAELDDQNDQLRRLATAIKDDPRIAAELARLEFEAVQPGEEVISVSEGLTLDPRSGNRAATAMASPEPWFGPAMRQLAASSGYRAVLLATAAVLTLLAFTFLQEPRPQVVSTASVGTSTWTRFWNRYRK